MPITLNGTTGIVLSGSAGLSSTGDGEVTLNNTLDVQSGGTGANNLNGIVKGDGSNALTAGKVSLSTEISGTLNVASGGTGLTSPGVSGNVLASDGTAWVSQVLPTPVVTAQPGNSGNLLTSNGTFWVSSAPRVNTIAISANTNAAPGNYYVATAVLTLTLPGSPAVGDIVGFSNPTINTTSVIARNSANILGLAENLTFDKANAAVVLQYSGASKGWVFV